MKRFKIGVLALASARKRNISATSDKDNVVRKIGWRQPTRGNWSIA